MLRGARVERVVSSCEERSKKISGFSAGPPAIHRKVPHHMQPRSQRAEIQKRIKTTQIKSLTFVVGGAERATLEKNGKKKVSEYLVAPGCST